MTARGCPAQHVRRNSPYVTRSSRASSHGAFLAPLGAEPGFVAHIANRAADGDLDVDIEGTADGKPTVLNAMRMVERLAKVIGEVRGGAETLQAPPCMERPPARRSTPPLNDPRLGATSGDGRCEPRSARPRGHVSCERACCATPGRPPAPACRKLRLDLCRRCGSRR